jgi:hypothetical protein
VPTCTRESLQGINKKVKGYVQNPSTSYIDLYPVYIGQ